MVDVNRIPIVDFAKCAVNVDDACEEDKKLIGDAIYEALSTVGFVYLRNTGVTEQQVEKVRKINKQFFDLDTPTKEKYLLNDEFFGYLGNEQERLNPKRPADLKEIFDVNSHAMAEHTIWPDEEVSGFSTTMKEFAEVGRKLAMRLLEVVAIGMDMKDKDLFTRSHSGMNRRGNNYSILRSLLYRPLPENLEVKPNQIRLGEHTDFGSLSLVFQDEVGGLQVEKFDGTYMEATPIPGTALVNVGDCMQYWTQGRLKAGKHRILIPTEEDKIRSARMSVGYFAKPNNDTMLTEIEYEAKHMRYQFSHPTEAFRQMTAGEYNEKKFRETYYA